MTQPPYEPPWGERGDGGYPPPHGAPPPPPQPYSYGYPYQAPLPPPRKTRWGLIIGLIAVAFVLFAVVGVIGIVLLVKNSDVVDAADVGLGDCLTEIPSDASLVASVKTVDCTEPHKGEVFAVITVPGNDFPGQARISGYQDKCQPALQTYSSKAMTDPEVGMFVLYPTEASWKRGDRAVTCIATTDSPRPGSLKN
ncbi:septum formation family protein [Mycolicibacterium fluoranthenivorans]|uniref:Septum formation n=1 Tax=Mycolicibacterium fluoranthenivorans TaxID=258505 RepID=A0A1G4WGV7_9MYCO|nr:septum formation family protein [Mycolicibacterium fluoranthenivorans]SCX22740.1 Septum formation [Mycolicibacterium fluoranthenivorans]